MSKFFMMENKFREVVTAPIGRTFSGVDGTFRFLVVERETPATWTGSVNRADMFDSHSYQRAQNLRTKFDVLLDIDGVALRMSGADLYELYRKLGYVTNALDTARNISAPIDPWEI